MRLFLRSLLHAYRRDDCPSLGCKGRQVPLPSKPETHVPEAAQRVAPAPQPEHHCAQGHAPPSRKLRVGQGGFSISGSDRAGGTDETRFTEKAWCALEPKWIRMRYRNANKMMRDMVMMMCLRAGW